MEESANRRDFIRVSGGNNNTREGEAPGEWHPRNNSVLNNFHLDLLVFHQRPTKTSVSRIKPKS